MCLLCAATNPFDPLAGASAHTDAVSGSFATTGASSATWTLTQIATQLTDGYWNWSGGGRRSFDVGVDRSITVDLRLLTENAQALARNALSAWTDVSGVRFVEIDRGLRVNEGVDARNNTLTTAQIGIGDSYVGNLGSTSDSDWVRVTLTAGRTYTITLQGEGSGGLIDPLLRLYRANGGTAVRVNDDIRSPGTEGPYDYGNLNSTITFTVPAGQGGTYFLEADGYAGAGNDTGRYRLSIIESGAAEAEITFDDIDPDGAYSMSDVSGDRILSSFVNIPTGWDPSPMSINSYWFQTYMHEIGHALGLGHAGNYNGTVTPGSQLFDNDSWMASVMSYISPLDNPTVPGVDGFLATLMPADIIAIQELYGTGVSTRPGNTVYGVGSNVGGYLGAFFAQALAGAPASSSIYIGNPFAFTIYDTGGIDTINLSTMARGQVVNLNATTTSSIGNQIANMVIARGVTIENAIGGRGNDRLIGNEAGNFLRGGVGVDTLIGNNGGDRLFGDAGADRMEGGNGNDILVGGIGPDAHFGGPGNDFASYADATSGVRASLLNPGTNTGFAAGDSYNLIENMIGSRFADVLIGNGAVNVLSGGAGNDILSGQAGNDTMVGGAGADRFDFNRGADVITDFANNVDTIALSRSLWGGATIGMAQILSYADDIGNDVIFRFAGANSLLIRGLASVNMLADDIVLI